MPQLEQVRQNARTRFWQNPEPVRQVPRTKLLKPEPVQPFFRTVEMFSALLGKFAKIIGGHS